MSNFNIQLKKELSDLNIYLNDHILSKLESFSQKVLLTNEQFNLTSIVEEEEIVTKQFVDCLASLPLLNEYKIKKLIDIGSGAGFPSFPLAIADSSLLVHSVDALQKRIHFQNSIIVELELSNICSYHGRAEIFGRDNEFREQYDGVVSRAVSRLSVILEYMSPFVKVGGYIITYKSKAYTEELVQAENAIQLLNIELVHIHTFTLRDNQQRTLLVFKKLKETPSQYPRKNGLPNKKPL